MGTKGDPYFYCMNLSLVTQGPAITTCTAGCTNSSSCIMPPFTPSAQGFELFYGNKINDPRVHSHQSDCSCYELLCKSSVCSKGCLAPFLSLPPKYILNSTTFVFSPDRIDGSKGGACQTPITPSLLLIQGFSVLSSPSAQGNIWTQDLSIFPENKMYYQRIKHQDLLVKLSALPLSLMLYSICEAWSFKRARVLESSPERKLMFISSWIKILLSLPQILCSLSIMSLR